MSTGQTLQLDERWLGVRAVLVLLGISWASPRGWPSWVSAVAAWRPGNAIPTCLPGRRFAPPRLLSTLSQHKSAPLSLLPHNGKYRVTQCIEHNTSRISTASSAIPGGLPRCCFCISAAARLIPAEVTASASPATAVRWAWLAAAAAGAAPALLAAAAGASAALCAAGATAALLAAADGSAVPFGACANASGAELLLVGLYTAATSACAAAACKRSSGREDVAQGLKSDSMRASLQTENNNQLQQRDQSAMLPGTCCRTCE